jgi:hypothetical protein
MISRRIAAAALASLAVSLAAPLCAGAASWTDAKHAPHASWTDSHAAHASWTDGLHVKHTKSPRL